MAPVVVIVCGEPMRGDDGVALAVVDALPPPIRALIATRRVGSLMPDDLLTVDGPVLIVDAVVGPAPGTLVELPLAAVAADKMPMPPTRSTHALPLPSMLGIVAALREGGLPPGRFLGVAVDRVGLGDRLSSGVAAAVPRAAARLAAGIRMLAHEAQVAPCA